eukprot:7115633-Pyramimonas_sp.AAC.1
MRMHGANGISVRTQGKQQKRKATACLKQGPQPAHANHASTARAEATHDHNRTRLHCKYTTCTFKCRRRNPLNNHSPPPPMENRRARRTITQKAFRTRREITSHQED